MNETKKCSKCGEVKSTAEFSKRGERLRSWCKACDREYNEANKDHKNEYMRAYLEANRERENARTLAYYHANQEQQKERKRAWDKANPGHNQDYYYLHRDECIATVTANTLRKKYNITQEREYVHDTIKFTILS